MKRILAVLTVLAIAGMGWVGVAWADQQGNNPTTPVAVSETSGTVTFSGPVQAVHFTNDGANPAIVRVFRTCETVATIATTDTRARLIKPSSEGWGLTFDRREIPDSWGPCANAESGFGYIGFAYVATAGLTTSLRWFAK